MTIENVQLVEEELQALEVAHKEQKFDTSIPTLDSEIREWLRRYGEPMHLFGENKGQRRTRLRLIYVRNGSKKPPASTEQASSSHPVEATLDDVIDQEGQTEIFYTEGCQELLEARREFAETSIIHALLRNKIHRAYRYAANEDEEIADAKRRVHAMMTSFGLSFSRIGSGRPLCSAKYAPFAGPSASTTDIDIANVIATGGWSGNVGIWQGDDRLSMDDIHATDSYRVHSLAWRPNCPVRTEPSAVLAIGNSAGGVAIHSVTAKQRACDKGDQEMDGTEENHVEQKSLYELDHQKLASFDTADDRISEIAWHPLGKHVLASSHDGTWRLYDIGKSREILVQEGHSMDVCSLAVHPDGSLVASGDAGGIIHVWDLRTGRSIMTLEQHLRRVLSLDFHPHNGCNLLSSGEDRTALIWDIRRRVVHDRLLGHTKLVSRAKYDSTGDVAVTAGYDGVVKVWDTASYSCVKNLVAHQSLIMGMDFRHRGKLSWDKSKYEPPELATVGYDRSLKIWRN